MQMDQEASQNKWTKFIDYATNTSLKHKICLLESQTFSLIIVSHIWSTRLRTKAFTSCRWSYSQNSFHIHTDSQTRTAFKDLSMVWHTLCLQTITVSQQQHFKAIKEQMLKHAKLNTFSSLIKHSSKLQRQIKKILKMN